MLTMLGMKLSQLFSAIKAKVAPKQATGNVSTVLVPLPPPKVKTGQVSFPGYAKGVKPSTAKLTSSDLQLTNLDLVSLARQGATTGDVIRTLARVSPDLSTAVSAYLRVGLPEKYTVYAWNPDGTLNREATQLASGILQRMDLSPDYTVGFAQTSTVRSVAEALGRELVIEGACSMELVLDKTRLPARFQPVPVSKIEFYQDTNVVGLIPKQVVGGDRIDLDQPTFIYTSLDQNLLTAYAQSPVESAVQPILGSMTFLNDLRRICARHVYPRYDVSIDEEKLRASIPTDVAADTQKLNQYLNGIVAGVEDVINGLDVEDALVHFDSIGVSFITGESGDVPATFDTVQNVFNSKVATGARVPPAILGHGADSQNVASTETMLFMMTANGMIRVKLQEVFSKAMTLAVRLFGLDVVVEFKFDSIDLRPDAELETFKLMKVDRVTTLLSLGFISDDQACLELTGQLTPNGYTPKTGTMFKTVTSGVDAAGNPYSNTSTGPGGGADQQARKPETPTGKKGPQKK